MAYAECEILFKVLVVVAHNGVGNLLHVGLHNEAYLTVGDYLGESAHIGDEHGTFEMEGYLGYAALCGAFVGLCDEVGGAEIPVHLAVGNEIGAEFDAVGDAELLDLLEVWLGIAIEFACNDEVYVALAYAWVGHCIEEEVETFVVSNEAEEKDVASVRVETEDAPGFVFGEYVAIVVVEGVRTELSRFLGVEKVQVVEYGARHGDEGIGGTHEVACKETVAGSVFVWDDVVEDGYYASVVVASHAALYCPEARGHEWEPELGDE